MGAYVGVRYDGSVFLISTDVFLEKRTARVCSDPPTY